MFLDAARALRTVRARAGEWNIDSNHVGIIGSSAGGHLGATLATKFDNGDTNATDAIERASSRPDAVVLCYPVITMDDGTRIKARKEPARPTPARGWPTRFRREARHHQHAALLHLGHGGRPDRARGEQPDVR